MNLQAQEMAAQVANQGGGASVPVMNGSNSYSNSNIVSEQIQAAVARNLDPDYVSARLFMTHKIYEFLMQRQQQSNEETARKVLYVVIRLEEGLFRTAATKEEYMNLETLENRLRVLIRRLPMNNPSNSSTSTMIPTPGMPQSGNSSLMRSSSVESSMVASGGSNGIVSSAVNAGNFSPSPSSVSGGMHNGSFNSSNGPLPHGYQQSLSTFSINSGGNNMVLSTGVQRIASQIIPTTGFNNSNNTNNNNYSNNINNITNYNHSVMNMDSNAMAYSTSGELRSPSPEPSNRMSGLGIAGVQARIGSTSQIPSSSTPIEASSSAGTVPLSVYVELRREHHELLGAKNQVERLMDTYTSMSPALSRDSTARLRALIETATTEMKEFPPATDVKHGHGRLVCQMMINEIQSIVNQEQKGHDD